jgi:putative MFS transporter
MATVAVGLGLFFDIYEIFLAGTLANVLVANFHLDKAILPAVLASTFVGMFVGAILLGRLADRIGRRRAFLVSLAVYSLFSLLGAFSVGPWTLMASRFLAGVGIGAEPAVADTYLGDLLPPKKRGLYTGIAYTLSFFGVPAVGFLAGWLVPLGPDAWRWLFVFGALGAVIVFLLRTGLPESPRWLESVGRREEAEQIVARFEAEAGGDLPEPVADEAPNTTASVGALLRPPYRRRTLMMAVFHLLQTFGYYGFGTLVPQVLAAKGYPIVQSLVFSAITFIGYPVGAALSLPIIERVERKHLVIASGLGMAVCGLAFGFSSSPALILTFGFLYTAVSNVFSNGFHVYQAEIFPTGLRSTAAGSTYALSRLSSAAMPFVLVPLLHATNSAVLFAVVAAAMIVVAFDVGLFGPRTTGRDLELVNI